VRATDHGARQDEPLWVPAERLFFNAWTPGVVEPEKLCGFIERLSDRIIKSGAKSDIVANP